MSYAPIEEACRNIKLGMMRLTPLQLRQAQKLYAKLDLNGDGEVTSEELIKAAQSAEAPAWTQEVLLS